MEDYKAIIFDLDDTLLDRNKAVEKMFLLILEKCYEDIKDLTKNQMLKKFIKLDKRDYGVNDKTIFIESFFDEFPPNYRFPHDYIQVFWNNNFPNCFSIDQNTINIINAIKKYVKVGIITNGSTIRQKAKINNTNLNSYFTTIIISEEVGICKPDKRIFELALDKLKVQPKETLFVGDDLEKDIYGCQNAKINGIWFNPDQKKNDTKIKPYAEIHSLDRLISFLSS